MLVGLNAMVAVHLRCCWAKDDHFIEADISHELSTALTEGPRLVFDDGGHYIQKTQSIEIADAFLTWLNG